MNLELLDKMSAGEFLDHITIEDALETLSEVGRRYPQLPEAFLQGFNSPVRERPSTWAEKSITLDSGPKPGPWRNRFKPWTASMLDIAYDNPLKEGAVIIKPAQIGASEAMMVQLVCQLSTDPGPVLYMTTTGDEAKRFANSRFRPFVMQVPMLAEDLARGRREGRRTLTAHFEFDFGQVDFVGSGDESGAISEGRRFVYLDEYELSSRKFPAASGELFSTAKNRTKLYRGTSFMMVFGHPRLWNADLHKLFVKQSDQSRWAWDCPHCGDVIDPTDFEALVDFKGGKRAAHELDPDDAVLVCPHCGAVVSDSQRAQATRPPDQGGTGRLWSPLSEEDARKQPMAGLWITTLSDPEWSVRDLAARLVYASTDEGRQTFFNKDVGQPYRTSKTVITADTIRECIQDSAEIDLPDGPHGVHFVTYGVDVQMPRENPTLYFAAVAYTPTLAYIVDLKVISGWAMFHEYRRNWKVRQGDNWLELAGGGIDPNWETTQVLENTRVLVHTAHGSRPIHQSAMGYNGKCHGDLVVAEVPEQKRMHPTRPELGLVDRKYLHRHTWVNRGLRRFADKRYVVLCEVPEDFEAHITSQVDTPVKKQHALERARSEWSVAKDRRDDWLHALVEAEAEAAIYFGLDRLHEVLHQQQRPVQLPSFGPN